MHAYMNHFYKRLHTPDLAVDNNQDVQQECLARIPRSITEEHNDILTQPPNLMELSTAIMDLPKRKAPRQDEIPSEFYFLRKSRMIYSN